MNIFKQLALFLTPLASFALLAKDISQLDLKNSAADRIACAEQMIGTGENTKIFFDRFKQQSADEQLSTLLNLTLSLGHTQTTRLLLKQGAPITNFVIKKVLIDGENSLLTLLSECGHDVNRRKLLLLAVSRLATSPEVYLLCGVYFTLFTAFLLKVHLSN